MVMDCCTSDVSARNKLPEGKIRPLDTVRLSLAIMWPKKMMFICIVGNGSFTYSTVKSSSYTAIVCINTSSMCAASSGTCIRFTQATFDQCFIS